jgi:hypothetical protein
MVQLKHAVIRSQSEVAGGPLRLRTTVPENTNFLKNGSISSQHERQLPLKLLQRCRESPALPPCPKPTRTPAPVGKTANTRASWPASSPAYPNLQVSRRHLVQRVINNPQSAIRKLAEERRSNAERPASTPSRSACRPRTMPASVARSTASRRRSARRACVGCTRAPRRR